MRNFWLYIVFILIIASCDRKEHAAVSFYYWKTNFDLSSLEQEALSENKVSKLYIRYFDLDVNPSTKEVFPVSPIHFKVKPTVASIVPVVFIQNKVMLEEGFDSKALAKKTMDFIALINKKNNLECSEIQIDCDWTLTSKNNYLQFIEDFKRMSKKQISVTIRLHQVKYFEKTKIPNADRAVLMYYNMGTIAVESFNSIYNRETASKYVKSLKKYPMALNFALPIYSWGIHISEGRVIGLRNKLNTADLVSDINYKQINEFSFEVLKSHYKKSVFYKKGDVVKIEAISTSNLEEMAEDLSENSEHIAKEIIFYDLDEINIRNYDKNIFKKITAYF
ncbi:hypothetical protein [Flavobacterium frigidarium]|uniref:hypothetical protein n=1 Tax=Flavobacterium frigidarium TaxID=99286 RepID=UPI00041905BE|nr:hypothetical protein [Flavobacterium frigidarium]